MDQDYIQGLRDTLKVQEREHEPWTSGVVNLKGPESHLYYTRKDGSHHLLNMAAISEGDIQDLVDACSPAPFGRGAESVLDDTYRKALKLEDNLFAWRFNPDSGNFIAQLAHQLSPWAKFNKGFRAEVSKLNIYTQGGFFKVHQDTPRSDQMFGSLVFTLPTPHMGGNLVLRHRARSFNFDTPTLLGSATSPSVAYVAFYSDVEHEVLEVTTGARITITFNLYYDPSRAPPIVPSSRIPIPENDFTILLRQAFRDASFVRQYRYLGFGLEYQYPKDFTEDYYPGMEDLKGPDAFLFYALSDVGLRPSLRYLYDSSYGSWGDQFQLLLTYPLEGRDEDSCNDTQINYLLGNDDDGLIVWNAGESEETLREEGARAYRGDIEDNRARSINVEWVTPPTHNLVGVTPYKESGNEPLQEIYYYTVCIVVDVSSVPCPPVTV
ncbi:hypothetical protein D9756_011599 [Leucocoprinus leucothites]|uniref:Fe2OG dioxygenase domain-containing protein n=1 Tax=Leucocoprinus leucothites TaxID=201217 RepID=A0A8H5CNV0_9AGAR|nr:hypothetical protein D9756_011599 [Leucoagaricus leucothites]